MEPPRTRITVFGGTWPAQIWRLVMLRATAGMSVQEFPTPEVRYLAVGVDTTQDPFCLPNEFTLPQHIEILEFIDGTEPTETCTSPTALQRVIVPSIVGFQQAQAMAQLRESGFYVEVQHEPSTQPAGTVIYQDPPGGTSELQTRTVRITLAQTVDEG